MDFSCKVVCQDHSNIHKGITQRGMNVLKVYLLRYWQARLTYEINHSLLLETLKKHRFMENIYYKAGGGRGREVLHLPEKKKKVTVGTFSTFHHPLVVGQRLYSCQNELVYYMMYLNKSQTNKISLKNPEKKSKDRYTMLLLLKLPECTMMRL